MARNWFFSISVLALTLLTYGCASPGWMKHRPPDDAQYRYYVGWSNQIHGKKEGEEAARENAISRAIEESFGTKYRYQRDTNEDINAAQVIDRSRERSRLVNIVGFREVDIHQDETDDNIYDTVALFQYPKAQIAAERERLKNTQDTDRPSDMDLGQVDSTPKRTPASAFVTTETHNVVHSTYLFGVGACGTSATMKDANNAAAAVCLRGEVRPFRYLGIALDGSLGGSSTSYTNGSLGMDEEIFGIETPIYFSRADTSSWSPFLSPGIMAVRSGFGFADSAGNASSTVAKWQGAASADAGIFFRFFDGNDQNGAKMGMTLRAVVGVLQPFASSGGITSETAFGGGIFLDWEMFRQ